MLKDKEAQVTGFCLNCRHYAECKQDKTDLYDCMDFDSKKLEDFSGEVDDLRDLANDLERAGYGVIDMDFDYITVEDEDGKTYIADIEVDDNTGWYHVGKFIRG